MTDDPIQEQLIAARRAQILHAAGKVFAEKGFHRATIPDIAKEAGIAVGTIYNYFKTKTDLLLGLLHSLNETEAREIQFAQSLDMDLRTFITEYTARRFASLDPAGIGVLQALLSEILINKELQHLYLQQVMEPTYATAEKYMQKWVENGEIKDVDARMTLRMVASTFLGVLILRTLGDPEINANWDRMPHLMTMYILHGFGGKHDDQ
jgi:AcrR family transcriptional regulator